MGWAWRRLDEIDTLFYSNWQNEYIYTGTSIAFYSWRLVRYIATH